MHRVRERCRTFLHTKLFADDAEHGEANACALEKHIYNWTVMSAKRDKIPLTWKYPIFRNRYVQRIMSIKFNLLHPDNPALFERLKKGEITYAWLARATPYDMFPQKWESVMQDVAMKQMRKEKTLDMSTVNDGAFTCGKCKSRKSQYYQLQTRSADEPMTTFVTCLNCNNRWKC